MSDMLGSNANKPLFLLRSSGSTSEYDVKVDNRSDYTDYMGNQVQDIRRETFDRRIETAFIQRAKGRFVVKTMNGLQVRWRNPAGFIRGHTQLRLSDGETVVAWSNGVQKGVGHRAGRPNTITLLDSGFDQSRFLENRSSMTPLLTYNELASHNTKLLLKVKDAQVNLSVTAAELKETGNMLAKGAKSLFGVYRAIRRGDFHAAQEFIKPLARKSEPPRGWSSKDVSGRWLEFQYGWQPLVGDLVTAYKWATSVDKSALTYRVSKRTLMNVPVHIVKQQLYEPKHEISAVGLRGVRTVLHYLIDSDKLVAASRWGLINPLVLGWELIPYSFVVDWFCPIGNFLETLDATVGKTFISGTRTKFLDIRYEGWTDSFYQGYAVYPYTRQTAKEHIVTGNTYSVSREALTSWPIALPYLKSPFSTVHVANAIALFRNLFKRKL